MLARDYSKARQRLGWEPTMSFEQLVASMVESDISLLAKTASNAAVSATG